MKKNLLTTMVILCAFVFGGMFTSCTTSDDNPSSTESVDPIAKKLCKGKTWIEQGDMEALNSMWAYTFNSDGSMMVSGLSKYGDPDVLIGMHFDGKWKAIKDYEDPNKAVNSNVRCYAVELKMKQICFDGENDIDIDDAPIYKDTLLVQYQGGKMTFLMTSDIERYLGEEEVSDIWGLVKPVIAIGDISEQDIIDSCIEYINNLDEDEIEEILGNLDDEDIKELIETLEVLTGEDFSDIIKGDGGEE